MKIIVAGPYIGELGFEIGNWVPHLAAVRKNYDSMVVFSRNGHKDLYPFADKFMGFDFGLETRHCDKNWMMQPFTEEVAQYTTLENNVKNYAQSLVKSEHEVFLELSDVKIRKLAFTDRIPIILKGSEEKLNKWKQILPPGRKVIFVVRSYARGASKNTNPKLLEEIVDRLEKKIDANFILVGQVETPFQWNAKDKCINLLNTTTIDDLIAIYTLSDIVVGASTGTIHLAAACHVPHVTWISWLGDVVAIKDRYHNLWNLNRTPVRYLSSMEVTPENIVEVMLTISPK